MPELCEDVNRALGSGNDYPAKNTPKKGYFAQLRHHTGAIMKKRILYTIFVLAACGLAPQLQARTYVGVSVGVPFGYGYGGYGGYPSYGYDYYHPYYRPYYAPPPVVYTPPPVVIQQEAPVYVERSDLPPASTPVRSEHYYCPDPRGFYPDIPRCPAGWEKISAPR